MSVPTLTLDSNVQQYTNSSYVRCSNIKYILTHKSIPELLKSWGCRNSLILSVDTHWIDPMIRILLLLLLLLLLLFKDFPRVCCYIP